MRAVIGGLLGLAIVLVLAAAVNGGYAYRTQCPGLNGSTETVWTYRIKQIIPYLAHSKAGCQVQSGTRVVLDAVGIWKFPATERQAASVNHSGDYTLSVTNAMQAHCIGAGKSPSFCECFVAEETRRFTPRELGEISAASAYDQLPGTLGARAKQMTSAVDHGC